MAEITKLEFKCDCGHEGAPSNAEMYESSEPTFCGCCPGTTKITFDLTCKACGRETEFPNYSFPTE